MTQNSNVVKISALVELEVYPREGQTLEEAASDMQTLLAEYLSEPTHPFMDDYGTTLEDIRKATEDDGDEPCWGGYEGPFVVKATVTSQPAQ